MRASWNLLFISWKLMAKIQTLLLVAPIFLGSRHCCFSLSGGSPTAYNLKANLIETNNPEPIILCFPEIISTHKITEMLNTIETNKLVPTKSYQEDVFSKDAWIQEDITFRSITRPLEQDNLIPPEYYSASNDDAALKIFVYAVTNHQNKIQEKDIIRGANIIQRRQALERWKSEEGQALMQLSLDERTADGHHTLSLGKRYEMPSSILLELQQLIPRILTGSWTVNDATLVKYSEGDSQVPHIDPCDATLLICLKSCEQGGATCFPILQEPRRFENKTGCGFLFFSSNAIAADKSRNTLSLHHGGKVEKGEKIVVQVMLDFEDRCEEDNRDHQKRKERATWFDVVKCL
mmetsp:Transcript_32072/g.47366  ORF Transcript_32072/g.47366 Transcript_32072/m.47366 type:complete len:349 (-) Transcript_32072:277-1323(-)